MGVPAKIKGALLKIFPDNDQLRASLIVGIRSDMEMQSDELHDFFTNHIPDYTKYKQFYDSRSLENQRMYYYEGTLDFTRKSIQISFSGKNIEKRSLILILDPDFFPPGIERNYNGGIAFAIATNDSHLKTHFYKMGLVRTDLGFISINDENIARFLSLSNEKTPYTINLSNELDASWYNFILESHRRCQ